MEKINFSYLKLPSQKIVADIVVKNILYVLLTLKYMITKILCSLMSKVPIRKSRRGLQCVSTRKDEDEDVYEEDEYLCKLYIIFLAYLTQMSSYSL